MISNDKTIEFVKRFRDIARRQADHDFELSRLARDIRHVTGTDAGFVAWCTTELGMTEMQAGALLVRGLLVDVVQDAASWNRLGGYKQIRALERVPTKRERVEIVEKAKAQNLQVSTVVRRERDAEEARSGVEKVKVPTAREDAETLAKAYARHVPRSKWSPHITAILARYADVTAMLKRVA